MIKLILTLTFLFKSYKTDLRCHGDMLTLSGDGIDRFTELVPGFFNLGSCPSRTLSLPGVVGVLCVLVRRLSEGVEGAVP